MKMKKLLAAALALAMVAALVPGLAVTAGAEADKEWFNNDRYDNLTMADWHTLAKEPIFTYPATQGDGLLSQYYVGWHSTWTYNNATDNPGVPLNGNNFTSQITNINTFWNSYQVYGGTGSKDTVTLPDYGKGNKFVILEFMHSRQTNDFKHEFAIKDTNGKIIETGYVRRGDASTITDGFASGKTDSFDSPEPADSFTTGVNQPVKISTAYDTGTRVVFVNNDDNTYSVIYYTARGVAGTGTEAQIGEPAYHNIYQPEWNDSYWTKMYTATYKGQFDGIGSIDYAVTNASTWSLNHRVNFLRVYTGNIVRSDYTVTISGAGENDGEYTVQALSADGITVPEFDGYIFRTKNVNDKKIDIFYVENKSTLGSCAVRNNTPSDIALKDMRLLGSHDSFTDKISSDNAVVDEGGLLYDQNGGSTGARTANSFLNTSKSMVVSMSKAQSADVIDQLNYGVRFFDIRLSRQNDGTLWTRHGLRSENFEGIAYSISQFANENPGEVIILDFHDMADALYKDNKVITTDNGKYGGSAGDDNDYAYTALASLLKKTGIMDYAVGGNTATSTTYSQLTANGTKTAIVIMGKNRANNCYPDIFMREGDKLYRLYEEPSNIFGIPTEDINKVINYINGNYEKGSSDNPNAVKVIEGHATQTDLLSDAKKDNPNFIENVNFENWMKLYSIVLLDGIDETTSNLYLAKLTEYTRDGFDNTYTNTVEGVTVEGPTDSVPFSTKLTVDKTDKNYQFKLTQFADTEVSLAGPVKLTFPDATGGISGLKTVVYCDGKEVGTAI